MNITEKIAVIAEELTGSQYTELVANQDYETLAQLLNTKPLISNPEPQGLVSAKIKTEDFVDAVTTTELDLIVKIPGMLDNIKAATVSRDAGSLATSLKIVSKLLGENFSDESKLKIQNLLTKTEPDPNYQTQIPGSSRAEELNIFHVTSTDIQSALNPYIPPVVEDAVIE